MHCSGMARRRLNPVASQVVSSTAVLRYGPGCGRLTVSSVQMRDGLRGGVPRPDHEEVRHVWLYMPDLFHVAPLEEENPMSSGTIKTLTDRGFGFITPESGSGDVFFHRSG